MLFAFNAAGTPATLAPEGAAYDVLADYGAEGVKRIQVKTGTMKDRGSWICRLSRSVYDKNGHGGHRAAVLVPIDVVEGLCSISLRKHDAYRVRGLYDNRLW